MIRRSGRSAPSRPLAAAVLGLALAGCGTCSGGAGSPPARRRRQSGQWAGQRPGRDRRSQPRRCHRRPTEIDGDVAAPARQRRRPRAARPDRHRSAGAARHAKATATPCARAKPCRRWPGGRSATRCCSMRWPATTISRCRPRSSPARPSRFPAGGRRRRRRGCRHGPAARAGPSAPRRRRRRPRAPAPRPGRAPRQSGPGGAAARPGTRGAQRGVGRPRGRVAAPGGSARSRQCRDQERSRQGPAHPEHGAVKTLKINNQALTLSP